MAKVTKVDYSGRSIVHTWLLTEKDSIGDSISYPGTSDHVVQFFGEFDEGSVVLEGSLDNEHFFRLTDKQGNVLSFTDDGGKKVNENPLYYRPRLSIRGTKTEITTLLFSRSTMR